MSGGRAPRFRGVVLDLLLFEESRAPRVVARCLLTELLDLVALSLLPPWHALHVAERLRAGDPPAAILSQFAPLVARDEPDKARAFRADAADAIARAETACIELIPWSDPDYP